MNDIAVFIGNLNSMTFLTIIKFNKVTSTGSNTLQVVLFQSTSSCFTMEDTPHNERAVRVIISETYNHLIPYFRNEYIPSVDADQIAATGIRCQHANPVCGFI
ncbi:hypothetical protein D3C86_1874730 [compost metagenome]